MFPDSTLTPDVLLWHLQPETIKTKCHGPYVDVLLGREDEDSRLRVAMRFTEAHGSVTVGMYLLVVLGEMVMYINVMDDEPLGRRTFGDVITISGSHLDGESRVQFIVTREILVSEGLGWIEDLIPLCVAGAEA